MPTGNNGIDQNDKLLDGRGLGTVLSLLKDQMDYDADSMLTFVTTTFVNKSAVTPVLVSGTTIANIDGKTIYAPAQSSSVHYARLAMDGNSELYFVNQADTFASLKARIEAGEEVILVLPKDIINDEPGDSYAYLANLFEENPQKEIADCLAFVTPHKAGTAYVLEVYSDGYISWNSDSVSIDHIYSPVVINVSPSLTTGITIGTVTTKNLQGNYTAATLYAPAAITNYVPAQVVDGDATGYVFNSGSGAGLVVTDASGSTTINSDIHAESSMINLGVGPGNSNEDAIIELGYGNYSNISMSADQVSIKGVITPTNDGDAANKKYVDDQVSGLTPYVVHWHQAVDFEEVTEAQQAGRPIYLADFTEGPIDQYLALTDIYFDVVDNTISGGMTFNRPQAFDNDLEINSFIWSSYDVQNGYYGWSSLRHYTLQSDWAVTTTTNIAYIKNKPDLSNYVLSSSVVSTGPTNGTPIANISGVTIYAPVAQGGVTVESDPVFTTWATGDGIAAYTITASDVEKWNGITGYVPITTTYNNVKTQFITQTSASGMTLRISDGNPSTHQALLKMESTDESYPKTKAQLLADDIQIQATTLTLSGVKTPTSNTDAANKKYVDDKVSGATSSIVSNVQADWGATTGLSAILNKPTLGTAATVAIDNFAAASHTHDFSDISGLTVTSATTSGTNIAKVGTTNIYISSSILTSQGTISDNGSTVGLTMKNLSNTTFKVPTYTTDITAPGQVTTKKYVDDQISGVTTALTTYVAKTDITPAAGITGTVIATIGGKTIYAPVSEEGIQSETDPVFTASAAYGITATDIANWNAKSSTTPVNADWSATTGLSSILNKPNLGTAATVAIDTFAAASHTHDYSNVSATRAFSSGTALATITIDSSSVTINVPNASASTAGITKVGASGGAAAYSHTHDYSKVSVTAVTTTGITIGTATVNNNGTTTTTTLYAPFSIVYDGTNTALVFEGF